MIDPQDPAMQEIIEAFCQESEELIAKLMGLLEKVEDSPEEGSLLEDYGQIIDRIMGAAESIGFSKIGALAKMGKLLGYKASQTQEIPLRELTISILFDTTEALSQMIENLKNKLDPTHNISINALTERLKWLAEKFKHIKRASVDF